MIMLNLFIGIIMNSMSEMHAEIAERDRQRHVTETGAATIEDELHLLERQIESLKDQVVRTRQRLRQESPHTSAP
jgi:septal ring factor EnvC (AmiA/AmiB activator)